MRFSLFIQDSQAADAAVSSALGFAQAAIAGGHSIRQMFFHGDGVRCAGVDLDGDADLRALVSLAQTHEIPLLACSTWIEKLGVISTNDIRRGSLGQWCDALDAADRLVSFRA